MVSEIFFLIALTAIYILAIATVYFVISAMGVPKRRAILVVFLVFGSVSGALAWAWPFDSAAYPNVYAMLLGDELYITATAYWGKAGSVNPDADIPWFLRVPQIYLFSAVILSGIAGWLAQALYNNRIKPE